jgi:hypothetical protein
MVDWIADEISGLGVPVSAGVGPPPIVGAALKVSVI